MRSRPGDISLWKSTISSKSITLKRNACALKCSRAKSQKMRNRRRRRKREKKCLRKMSRK